MIPILVADALDEAVLDEAPLPLPRPRVDLLVLGIFK